MSNLLKSKIRGAEIYFWDCGIILAGFETANLLKTTFYDKYLKKFCAFGQFWAIFWSCQP